MNGIWGFQLNFLEFLKFIQNCMNMLTLSYGNYFPVIITMLV